MQRTFEGNPFFEVHAFSHYFSKALDVMAFKDLDTVRKFIDSLDDQAMTALCFIIKMAEIEPY